jgi:hypothetical protein
MHPALIITLILVIWTCCGLIVLFIEARRWGVVTLTDIILPLLVGPIALIVLTFIYVVGCGDAVTVWRRDVDA